MASGRSDGDGIEAGRAFAVDQRAQYVSRAELAFGRPQKSRSA
jgi:hypothetical protein